MKVQILNDVKSTGKNIKMYAQKYEVLDVLKEDGDMLLLKGKKEHFPINKSKVKILQ